MSQICNKAIDEWKPNVTKVAIEKNWRKLLWTIDESYTVLHLCSDNISEKAYDMVVNYVYMNLIKLLIGYIYTDAVLYGEYLLSIFRRNEENPLDILENIHTKINSDKEITVDEIKHYVIKLISALINYIYTPY